MANDLLLEVGTPIVLRATGGGDVLFTPQNLADNAGRMSASVDLGAKFAKQYDVTLESKLQAAPTAGEVIEVYWGASPDNAKWRGKTTGSDATYPATVDHNKKQLELIGVITCHNTTDAQVDGCSLRPLTRYGVIVWVNKSGQTLTNTAGDHIVTLTPAIDEIQ